jgi:uroporphyrinogen III methyltransferase/synthase
VKRGRVILVGAGPGAPDLITLRGAEALRAADAVIYDALASNALLALAPPEALRIDVGKRGHDAPTRPQEEITALLLRLAAEGRTVVRLKGGDPYIFGRGGEEASACARAGIDFEVVPGVSSVFGALAYAGIPLTDRRHGASFVVTTGHKDPSKAARETRWDLLANAADTVVVLMGARNLGEIATRLIEAGRSPATPAAVVMNGTLPSQRVVEAPLGELAERAREAGVQAPAVIVVGDVASLRGELSWFERLPLFGRRVLVTRSDEQAGDLVQALESAGAEPVVVPMIRLLPAQDASALDAALTRPDGYDTLVFTSANAVRFTAARARLRGVDLTRVAATVFCVGPASADAARAEGLAVHGVPVRHDAEGLIALLKALPLRGRRILIPRSSLARDVLPEGLRREGALVDAVVAYRTEPAPVDAPALRAELAQGGFAALTFASPSAARHFAALLDAPARAAARRCVVVAIGPITAEALAAEGLPADVIAEAAHARALVGALAARLVAGREGAR